MGNDEAYREERGFERAGEEISEEERRKGENRLYHDLVNTDHTHEECGYDGSGEPVAMLAFGVPEPYVLRLTEEHQKYLASTVRETIMRLLPDVNLDEKVSADMFLGDIEEMVIPELEPDTDLDYEDSLEPEMPMPLREAVSGFVDELLNRTGKTELPSEESEITTYGRKFNPHVAIKDILSEAEALLAGPRVLEYGNPIEMHGRIAQAWENVFGMTVTEEHVALAMLEMKIERSKQENWNLDSLHDLVSYAAIYGAIKMFRKASE